MHVDKINDNHFTLMFSEEEATQYRMMDEDHQVDKERVELYVRQSTLIRSLQQEHGGTVNYLAAVEPQRHRFYIGIALLPMDFSIVEEDTVQLFVTMMTATKEQIPLYQAHLVLNERILAYMEKEQGISEDPWDTPCEEPKESGIKTQLVFSGKEPGDIAKAVRLLEQMHTNYALFLKDHSYIMVAVPAYPEEQQAIQSFVMEYNMTSLPKSHAAFLFEHEKPLDPEVFLQVFA